MDCFAFDILPKAPEITNVFILPSENTILGIIYIRKKKCGVFSAPALCNFVHLFPTAYLHVT